jgi:pyruvate formate lyase activating enzyme
MKHREKTGIVFNIQKFSVHDGPGIRTTVFMKGCPLQCHWCANAESIGTEPELGIIRNICNHCGKCLDVCPEKALRFDDNDRIQVDRNRCTACGECVAVCPTGALTIYGKQVTVDDVFKEIEKDKAFYEGSNGGITVSGGEPLRQSDFITALFKQCHEAGIGTCLDTCGYAATDKLKDVLAFTDYILYDIKHMDTARHQQFTGVANNLILNNAKVIAESGIPVLYRIPLIKNINDTTHNIRETIKFIQTLGNDTAVEFLPYHRLGIGKYQTLDRPYRGETFQTPSSDDIETLIKIFKDQGIQCNVSV